MQEQGTREVDLTDLLKGAGTIPAGEVMEAYNPLNFAPAVRVGKEWTDNMTLAGVFQGTRLVDNDKLKFGAANVHRIRLASGKDLDIWGTRELDLAFGGFQVGQTISIKYLGLKENPRDASLTQHMFEYKRGKTVRTGLN